MKTIWFDISHTAQFNFYINAIKLLCLQYEVIVTVLDRGTLPKIARKELNGLPNIRLLVVGKHRGNKFSAIFEANILRVIRLLIFLIKNKVRLHISNGYQGSLISKKFAFRVMTFGDDPQALGYRLKLLFASSVYYCLYSNAFVGIELNQKVRILACIKEWAYLSPKYFCPKKAELTKYGLKPYQYIFIREVSTGTLNYVGQQYGLVTKIIKDIPEKYEVVLSLEDKSKRELYPESWILLQEPVDDIHSLIYYSRSLVSSGDSMAREGAVLGIPSFYVGKRTMPANEVLKSLVDFYQVDAERFRDLFSKHVDNFSVAQQRYNVEKLSHHFIDITEFIINSAKSQLEAK